jgi:phosphoglycerol geranylgeranyltransferase
MNVYNQILAQVAVNKKMLAVLIDPDKCENNSFDILLLQIQQHTPDFIFIGGSQLKQKFCDLILQIKNKTALPVILFPGDATQFSAAADALLFLSLISGRNPEYLIGQHVNTSIQIKASQLEVIPTGYMLIAGGRTSAVEYVSNTRPIPREKNEIALATAIAGELLGMKLLYLEAGSGAQLPVPVEMIQKVKAETTVPLLVGGGITSYNQAVDAYKSGADMLVIGNALETSPEKLADFIAARNLVNS